MKSEKTLQHDISRTIACCQLNCEDFASFQTLSGTSGKIWQDYLRECVLECKITVYLNLGAEVSGAVFAGT